jgi:DNA-binding NarL/FixJ family response regulator
MNTATWNEKESAARKRSHVRSDVPCQDDNGTIAASAESSIHVRRDLKQPAVQSAEPTKTIRVLLVDDHPVVRKGLRCALSGCEQIAIVGEAADGLEAMRMAKELLPHLVLMDIDMPHMNGLMVAERLTNDNPQIKVLVLSMHGDPDNILSILQCGARGFVLKDAPAEDLVRAIERVDSGETFFSVEAERMVINQFVSHRPEEPRTSQLTKREREVLVAIADGFCSKEIACRLDVGLRTVGVYRKQIMSKLNIYSIAGLTRFTLSRGWIHVQNC